MRVIKIISMIIAMVCFTMLSCSAAVPQNDLIINGIYLGMDKTQVENITGAPSGTEHFMNMEVNVYDRGQVKITYDNGKLIRIKVTDRNWKTAKGFHCGGMDSEVKRKYGYPDLEGEIDGEKSYAYHSVDGDVIEFIAIEGYIQEITIEKKV